MGLLDKTYKENIESTSQDIADKYIRLILGNKAGLYQGSFANDTLYINGDKSHYHVPLKVSALQDIYSDIKRDFTISSYLGVAIYTDL